ncbi:hypothetical protein HPB47_025989 [Ixodes persulcatus]|uniref:Uncharacterized protein n=1 Tax=Ixodes persulcatus TaxID=34615 RepID=A0AC60PZZ1_IXOPE|nr:hypothetical protein HPB47_025989 [Ixodes persulcatus]
MIVTTQGQVKDVVYQKQHYGHDMDVGHLTLTDKERAEIAGYNEGHQDFHQRTIATTSTSSSAHRSHNIKRQFNITYNERCHQDDHTSVGIWAQAMMSQDNSLVKLFKQPGMADPTGRLSERDFALVLMTEPQQELLQKLGTDKICIDSTHGTTGYDFLLTTLLVVDEFGSGVPCAYLLTNRADTIMMKIFFEAVREAVGVISAKVFMSDDASEFYNAWSAVMLPAERQLLCTWHVDKNWNLKIRKLVEGQELMASVYKAVRVLLECPDQEEFTELLKAFVDSKDPSLKLFLEYFTAHYAKRKKNKRVDKLISALIDMTYDKLFQRLVKLCKGKPTTRIARINKNHLAALKIDAKDVLLLEEDAWSVKSQSINGLVYRVSRVQDERCKGCHLQCEACKRCVHDYTGTCLDHVARFTICKHIHAVILKVSAVAQETLPSTSVCEMTPVMVNDQDRMLESIKDLQATTSFSQVSETIATAQRVIGRLSGGRCSKEAVRRVRKLMSDAEQILTESEEVDNLGFRSARWLSVIFLLNCCPLAWTFTEYCPEPVDQCQKEQLGPSRLQLLHLAVLPTTFPGESPLASRLRRLPWTSGSRFQESPVLKCAAERLVQHPS